MRNVGVATVLLVVSLVACEKKKEEPAIVATTAASPVASAKAPDPSIAPGTGPFEGEIVVMVKDTAGQKLPPSITYDIKGDKVRYAPATGSLRAQVDPSTQHAYAIDDAQKAYRDVDTKPGAGGASTKVAKTGKTEKIAGLDCEDWTIEGGDEKAEVCAAKGIAFFDIARDPKPGSVEPPWAAALMREKAFPMRVVVHDKAGKEQFRAEASKVDRKKIDDALFQLPSGFKKSELDVKQASLP
jgi:hypothetical protein